MLNGWHFDAELAQGIIMNRWRLVIGAFAGISLLSLWCGSANAQYVVGGYYGTGLYHGGVYTNGVAVGAYPYAGGYPYNNWYGSPYRAGIGYTTNYGIGYGLGYGYGYGPGYGVAGPVVVAPNPVYGTTTTIIRGGPTGGVVQYSHNGNGYTYVPDSTYPTVIQQQPTLGLSRTIVPPSPPPVVIESRPQGTSYGLQNSAPPTPAPSAGIRSGGTIKLLCPVTAPSPLTYSLNGHAYTIQPGYSQSFREDREWTLEFKRGTEAGDVARYSLKAGTYSFVVGANGWELQQPGQSPAAATLPDAPLPDLTTTPSLPPTPLPPP